jgi:calcium-dependent protein kinase
VILYILICGRPPFGGKNNTEILTNVAKGNYSFDFPQFKSCSKEVKDLISKLLIKAPEKRITSE